ncbi:MAG: GyrI-like domain-containing protein [Nocardioidaceae bacterium]|nr:GyrI-like domain-containing protein [Nocardioidaceae bacterium]
MSWDDPDVVPAELCRYDLGVTAGPLEAVPPGTTRRWVPTCAAASLAVRGDLADVDVAWQRLHRSWLPTSSYGRAALPAMEWFHTTPPTNPSGHWDLDCLIPVVLHRKIRQAVGRRRGR